jgi:hypothetical protein
MGKTQNAHNIKVGNPEEKRPLGDLNADRRTLRNMVSVWGQLSSASKWD